MKHWKCGKKLKHCGLNEKGQEIYYCRWCDEQIKGAQYTAADRILLEKLSG